MGVARNILVCFLLLLAFYIPAFAQQSDSLAPKIKVYSNKIGFIKQKAIFLKIKGDSAFVFSFDAQTNFAFKNFSDTIILQTETTEYESTNCLLKIVGNQYLIELKPDGKQVKLKSSLRAELNTFLNESWINEQRELFFKANEENPKSYTLYDQTITKSGLLNLLEKEATIFLNAYFSAFQNVKFEDDEGN